MDSDLTDICAKFGSSFRLAERDKDFCQPAPGRASCPFTRGVHHRKSSTELAEEFPVSDGRLHRFYNLLAEAGDATRQLGAISRSNSAMPAPQPTSREMLRLRLQKTLAKNSFQPITDGIGHQLLQKMGWRDGEGLGRLGDGLKEPVVVKVKADRTGLAFLGEKAAAHLKSRQQPRTRPRQKQLQPAAGGPLPSQPAFSQQQKQQPAKSPVSQLLEFAQRMRWPQPVYRQVGLRAGPSSSSRFLFSVQFLGIVHTPEIPSRSKKAAKADAAAGVLRNIGIPAATV